MNTSFNYEVPEFYPFLSKLTEDGYLKISNTIKLSRNLPSGISYELFETVTSFNVIKHKVKNNIIEQSNRIITEELKNIKLKLQDDNCNTDKIIDANDNILDRVNINIDILSGVSKPNDMFIKGIKESKISAWNAAPVISSERVDTESFSRHKYIKRPQLSFKDKVDNTENLWVPKITYKPHSITQDRDLPLSLRQIYDNNGQPIGYKHPYDKELEQYQPPVQFLNRDTETATFPPLLEQTRLSFIITENQLDQLLEHLKVVSEFSIDLEHHSLRSYQGFTCLIQISTDSGGDFIIDALALREHIQKLNIVFTDPNKLKVFHGADNDVLWLQRDFGIYIVGLFDTYQAARVLGFPKLSLKYLLQKYCKVNTDKRFQTADWRIRPLSDKMIKYARMDTHYLLYIWKMLKQELLDKGNGQPLHLLSVFNQSTITCMKTYTKERIYEHSHLSVYRGYNKIFDARQMAALKMLYKWRDTNARELDESPAYLIPNNILLSIAENMPPEIQGLKACCGGRLSPFLQQNLNVLHTLVIACRQIPLEPQLYQMPRGIRPMVNYRHPTYVHQIHDLSYLPHSQVYNSMMEPCRPFSAHTSSFPPRPLLPWMDQRQPSYGDSSMGQMFNNVNRPYERKPFNCYKKTRPFTSVLAEAKFFIPPYDRYRKYRNLAQSQEIKEFKQKEDKIVAYGQGNELIKADVLMKLQQSKEQLEKSQVTPHASTSNTSEFRSHTVQQNVHI